MQRECTAAQQARFWAKVDKNGPIPAHAPDLGPCWLWLGTVPPKGDGYGFFHVGERTGTRTHAMRAHRFSWQIHFGAIPGGQQVLHRCDNRQCVNPAHLFLGTLVDNMADRNAKGRQASGMRNGRHTHPETTWRGGNGQTHLTADTVRLIRARRGSATHAQIAQDFGTTKAAVDMIMTGRTWKHVA